MSSINKKIEDMYSLTPLQNGMLFHYLMSKESGAYVLQNAFDIGFYMDATDIENALVLLSKRYSVLRTMIIHEKVKNPGQIVLKERKIELNCYDYSESTNFDKSKEYEEIKQSDLKRGFDLQRDSLLRVMYIKLPDNKSKLILTMHHIIVDGWCLHIIFSKFLYYYIKLHEGTSITALENEVASEKNKSYEYSDYVKWLLKQDTDKAVRYWEEELEGYDSEADIKPMKKPDPTEEQIRKLIVELDILTTEKLKKILEENDSTINAAAEVAVGILLQKYNRCKDVVFAKTVSGRNTPIKGIEEMVGLFVNTIPVRVISEDNITVTELLKKQQEKDIESTSYDYCSLADIQNKTSQGSELIKVIYVFENYMSGIAVDENTSEEIPIKVEDSREQTNYMISIAGFENEGKLCFKLLYDPNMYCEEEAQMIMERLLKICEEMANKPYAKVCELETVTEAEKPLILNDFNATETEYPRDKTVVELFEEQVRKTPDNTALVFEEESLTYAELNARANSLAYKLRENGVKPDNFVAIIADRSIEMICGIYGIIKAGGAYVPIDPTYPEDRVKFIIEDCHPKAILKYTTESIELNNEIAVIDLEDSEVWEGMTENPEYVNRPDNALYCIYTSGTTGKPKGVIIEHNGIVNLSHYMQHELKVTGEDRVLLFANYIFDGSVWEIVIAHMNGAALYIPDDETVLDILRMEKYVSENEISVSYFPPAYFVQGNLGLSKYVVTAGSSTSRTVVEKAIKTGDYINSYGPTEASICTTNWIVNKGGIFDGITIGKPISNKQVYILDGDVLCGIGVPGELCIAGDGLARGYLNRPELTEEKFVKNPFGEGRMYRSGDLARWLPDGNIEYLGRIDEQVKIRGFRIELGEIESKIREIENIRDCAVTARADSTGDKAIYAYYTSDTEVSVSEIRDRLSESLPEYMVPAYMTQIESIPVTRNGKLDKRALPEIEAKATREYAAPRNEIEEKICNIFSEILNVEQVGIKDSFFELGGHSLRATRLVNRIEAETGTRIALKEVFSHPTAEQLAVLAGAESEEYVPIPKAEEKEYYPMSSAQKRTYLIQQMQPEAVTYNMPQNMKLMGEVYPEKLKEAMQEMINRHEILRTQFLMIDGEPVQKIIDHVEADFEHVTSKEPDEKLISEYMKPFDLESGKTIRAKLVNKGEYHLLMLDMHHIVGDGMSMNTFMREVMALYNGEKLEPLTRQFKDYSEWMRSRDLRGQKEYWKSRFEDEIPVLDMPTDYPRPQEQSYAGTMTGAVLDEEASRGVKKLISRSGATDYMVFLAAAMVTLSKYSRQEDIVIGSPISGRTHRDTESMLGMFVNTLAMRGKPEKKKTFIQFLKEIKSTCLKAYENQEYPFEELVEAAEVQRDMSRNPLFDVMLVMQNNESTELRLGNSSIEGTVIESTVAKFDMTFNINEYNGRYVIGFEYCTDLFKKETAERILEHYIEILKAVTENAEQKISEIEMATPEERKLILNDFNATETEYPRDKTVVELFEEQVRKTPDNTALVFGDKKLTYAELNARANGLAYKLRENGVKPDDFVAIIADRSIEMICGIYGIIKAGGAYVPIDPTYPEERIRFMLEDCQPKAVLKYTTESIELNNETAVIDLADGKVWEGASENPEHVNTANDLIYCIYTSGTTGKPKGVANRHQGIVNLISWMQEKYPLSEEDVILQKTTYVFDVSASEIFWWFMAGAKLALLKPNAEKEPEVIAEEIQKYGVTVIDFVPSMLSVFMVMSEEYIEQIKGLRYILAAGEALNANLVKEFYAAMKRHNSKTLLGNIYGPTEAAVYSTYYDLNPEFESETVLIGRPVANVKAYITNGENLCGIGVPGELCIAGDGLARGYLNRPELTAEKFVKNPFGEGRMYRSGDLAKWLPDGNIEYLGRIDEQVKIRGFRIELGEIESRIREIEGIRDCAVTARADSTGDKAIYAYYTSDAEVSVSEIRDRLRESLPEYMVPVYMTQIESIPVTRNGKLDKRALPEIEAKATREYAAPRNEIEEKICNIFSEILNVEQVGIKDSFFELGGHSLRATRLVNRIEAETGTRIALKEVFSHPTAEQLAVLAGAESEEYVPIPKAEEKEYYPMSSAQKRTYLIQQMQPEAVTYNMPQNMKLMGEVYPEKLKEAMQEMINRHEILRTQFLMIDGEPVQKIIDHAEADFEYVTSKEPDEKLISEYMKPFDLESGKTIRAKLVNKGEYHLLTLDMHHIVGDGMSMNTFMRELMALYNGEKLEPLTRQFKDYSEWMRSRDLRGQEEYWKSRFEDEIPVLDMPTDYPRPQEQSYAGTMTGAVLDEEASQGVKKLISRSGATDYMVFLAAAMVTLSKYSRQEDIVIGSPISGRTHRDTESMLGMFVNTLAMRGKPEKKKTFIRFLKEIKSTCLKAYENQEYPFEELVEAAEVQRDMSRNPLFDVMLVMQNNESTELRLGNSSIEGTVIESTVAKFDMTFNINEYNGRYVIGFEYCTDLFKKETAERILEHYIEILKAVTENAEKKLGDIEMVTPEERKLILNDFNATETEYPRDKTVVELFEEQVRKTPDNTALVFEEESLTYAELNARANSLAYKLRENGVKPDDFVAIIADRSIEMICGIYGIIKAGGAYVPIDPTYPEERIRFMLEDCQPKAVLKYTAESIKLNNEIAVIDLADGKVWEGASENPEHVNTANDLIYCIYTSGTTGKPKGSIIENKSVVRLVKNTNYIELDEHNVILQTGSMSFDASTLEVWGALLNGGKLVISTQDVITDSEKLRKLMSREKVNTMWLTSTLFNQMISEENDIFDSLEHLLIGGEKLSDDHVRIMKSRNNGVKLTNGYGPTENTTFTTTYEIPAGFEIIPIGKPISNTKVYIANGENLCGIGVPGELCIAGDGLARGYLNRPELTEEKFVKNPFGEGRMYRSGDLARWLPDGNIEYLGRIDEQVKIRGFRIELGEIESRIREIEGIRDCAVTARADSTGDKAIYAYYTSDAEVSVSEIRDRLSESLPEYMVPAYMTQIESIPVTRNGKLDKRALPEIETKNTREYAAPRNEIEEAVCHAFSEILNVEQVGIKDSFFELGGDSIKAIRIISKLRNAGYTATVKDVMTGKNVLKISEIIAINKENNNKIVSEQQKYYLSVKDAIVCRSVVLTIPEFDIMKIKDTINLIVYNQNLYWKSKNNKIQVENCEAVDIIDIVEYSNESDMMLNFNNIEFEISQCTGSLVRFVLFINNESCRLAILAHPAILDSTSLFVILSEFVSIYKKSEKEFVYGIQNNNDDIHNELVIESATDISETHNYNSFSTLSNNIFNDAALEMFDFLPGLLEVGINDVFADLIMKSVKKILNKEQVEFTFINDNINRPVEQLEFSIGCFEMITKKRFYSNDLLNNEKMPCEDNSNIDAADLKISLNIIKTHDIINNDNIKVETFKDVFINAQCDIKFLILIHEKGMLLYVMYNHNVIAKSNAIDLVKELTELIESCISDSVIKKNASSDQLKNMYSEYAEKIKLYNDSFIKSEHTNEVITASSYFLASKGRNDESDAFFPVPKKYSLSKIQSSLNRMIIDHPALRAYYDYDKDCLSAYKIDKDIEIPIFNVFSDKQLDNFVNFISSIICSEKKLVKPSVLAWIYIVELSDKYMIVVNKSHAVWDGMCQDVFSNLLDNYLNDLSPRIVSSPKADSFIGINRDFSNVIRSLNLFYSNVSSAINSKKMVRYSIIANLSSHKADEIQSSPISWAARLMYKIFEQTEMISNGIDIPLFVVHHNRNEFNSMKLGCICDIIPIVYQFNDDKFNEKMESLVNGKCADEFLADFILREAKPNVKMIDDVLLALFINFHGVHSTATEYTPYKISVKEYSESLKPFLVCNFDLNRNILHLELFSFEGNCEKIGRIVLDDIDT